MKSAGLGTLIIAMGLVGVASAQQSSPHPDLSGFWEHSATSKLPGERPAWTSEGRRLLQEDQQQHWHDGVSEENTFCLPAGLPFMMTGSEGFDIVHGSREVTIINEERPSPRHIYLNVRQHPSMDDFDRTTVGHSIGHWEGDELVVDTVGFKAGATVGFVRSEASHLTERYHLEQGGERLRITSTWTDPQLLSKPYTTVYLTERAPTDRFAQEYYCDPRDPARAKP